MSTRGRGLGWGGWLRGLGLGMVAVLGALLCPREGLASPDLTGFHGALECSACHLGVPTPGTPPEELAFAGGDANAPCLSCHGGDHGDTFGAFSAMALDMQAVSSDQFQLNAMATAGLYCYDCHALSASKRIPGTTIKLGMGLDQLQMCRTCHVTPYYAGSPTVGVFEVTDRGFDPTWPGTSRTRIYVFELTDQRPAGKIAFNAAVVRFPSPGDGSCSALRSHRGPSPGNGIRIAWSQVGNPANHGQQVYQDLWSLQYPDPAFAWNLAGLATGRYEVRLIPFYQGTDGVPFVFRVDVVGSACSTAITSFQANPGTLNTAAGGKVDLSGQVTSTGTVNWSIDIVSPYTGGAVRTYAGTGLSAFARWDGTNNVNQVVTPGVYTARLTATSGPTCSAQASVPIVVDDAAVCSLYTNLGSQANLASGRLSEHLTLFGLRGGALPAGLALSYDSLSEGDGPLGPGWTHSYEAFLHPAGAGTYALRGAGRWTLLVPRGQAWAPLAAPFPVLTQEAGGAFVVTEKTGLVHRFDAAGRLTAREDRNGNALAFFYDDEGRVAFVADPAGRTTAFAYDSSGRVTSVMEPGGGVFAFDYEAGRLAAVAFPEGAFRTYAYDSAGRLAAQTDPLGHTTTYAYDPQGRVVEGLDPEGNARTLTYDPHAQTTVLTEKDGGAWTYRYDAAAGVLLEKEDPQGGVQRFAYDAHRNLLSSADPTGAVTAYAYDDAANLLTETDPLGQGTAYTYTARNELASVTDPEGRTTTFAYDERGNLTATTEPSGAVTFQEFDPRGQVLRRIGPSGEATAYTYDLWGNLASVTPPTGVVTQMVYDLSGHLLSRTDANGQTTAYTYDVTGRLVEVTGPGGEVTAYAYDAAGNRIAQTDPNGQTTFFTYDRSGRLATTTDPAGGVTTYTYGGAGCPSCGPGTDRLTSVTDPRGGTTTYAYDLLGRRSAETDPAGNTTRFAYDSRGNLVTKTDPENRVTHYAYDALNRRTTTTDALGGTVVTAYTPAGQVASVTDPLGVTTSYAYDAAGRLARTSSFDAGTTGYTYNPDGTLATKTDPNGVVATYSYDAAGRVTRIAFPSAAEDILYGYDALTSDNGQGRLTSMIDPSGTTRSHYDPQGRLTREEKTVLGVAYTTRYAYDPAGNLVEMTYPSGRTVTYPRDARNRPTAVTATLGTPRVLAAEIAYDPAGSRTRLALGNGLTETWTYDPTHRVASITVPGIAALAYTYDAAGNILAIADTVNPASSKAYAYDALDRLTAATGPWGGLAWTYDRNGNRLTETRNGAVTSYGYTGNRLATVSGTTTAAYQYDLAGNTTTDGWRTFVYNQNQRLMQVNINGGLAGEYTYNAKQQRVIKKTGPAALASASPQNVVYHYDLQGSLIEETAADGKLLTDYVTLEGKPLAMIRKQAAGEETFWYHDDHLGSPMLLTDKLGKVVWNLALDPFGNPVPSKGRHGAYIRNVDNNLRFPGQYYDAESGLHQNWWRDYEPRVGRYFEVDPSGLKGDMNPYLYAHSSPLRFVDPLGLKAGDVCVNFLMKRRNISKTGNDKYGHWWTEVNGLESYGWWPKYPVDTWGTITGVEGELNGQTSFGGTPTLDPHHGDPAEDWFHPKISSSSATCDEAAICARNFARSYSGSWSWPFGQNCRSFQKGMMSACCLYE